MTNLRENFVTFDFDTLWDDYSDDVCELVALSQREVSIIMSCLRVTRWGTRWFADTQLLRDIGRDDDLETAVTYIEQLERKLLMTGCLDGLIEAIEGISTSIAASSCCAGASAGGAFYDDQFYYGSEEPLDEPTGFGPGEEFATEEAYLSHKCETANAIVNSLIGTLDGFTVLTLASLTLGTAVIGTVGLGLLVAAPVAIIIALLATGFVVATFHTLANAVDANKDTLVCVLFNSGDALEAYDEFKQSVEDIAIDIGVLEISLGALGDLVMNLCPIDTFNKLYTSVGLPAVGGSTVDCDLCGECPAYTVPLGSYNPVNGVLTSVYNPASERYEAFINFNKAVGSSPCGDPVDDFTVVENNSPKPNHSGNGHRCWNSAGTLIYNSDAPPSSLDGVQQYNAIDDTSNFSVTLTYTE